METDSFILAAYAITAALLAAVCFATWLAARRVKQQLQQRGEQ